ncbi:YdcF family protein [Planctomycetota bacterium]
MNTVFFWLSKLVWLLISPGNLLVVLLLTTCILFWRGKQRYAKYLLSFLVIVCLTIALLPVGEWVLYPLEARFPTNPVLPEHIDGILVLGGSEDARRSHVWQQTVVSESSERLLALISLARQYPAARLVYSGGSGSLLHQEYKGSDVAEAVFKDCGLDLARVLLEENSRNTFENIQLTQKLVQPHSAENWILITSAWHMPRAIGIARQANWSVIPYPVDHWTLPGKLLRLEFNFEEHLKNLSTGIREWVGLTAYYMNGKTSAWLPAPHD